MPSPAPATGPIKITYTLSGAQPVTEAFDYLIVACDPRGINISDPTALETEVKKKLTSFTFRTSLFKANRPEAEQLPAGSMDRGAKDVKRTLEPQYAVRFNPDTLEKMSGECYGFRDEVYAHDPKQKPSKTGSTWCTTYQLLDRELITKSDGEVDDMRADLDAQRDRLISDTSVDNKWFDWTPDHGKKRQPEEETLVDYFPHFDATSLEVDGLPWKIFNAQGAKRTFYVSAFTCFESVLHCYLYGEKLMDPEGRVVREGIFPVDDKNARFAICGAGVSGLLFASQHLKKGGYNNFKIFEKSDRFGGKTVTHRKLIDGEKEVVPCELGTCYLSPAYEPMYWMFKTREEGGYYSKGNQPIDDAGKIIALDGGNSRFRSIIETEERIVSGNQERVENGVEYATWTVLKNGTDNFDLEKMKMTLQTVLYVAVHYAVFGMGINDCMPTDSPQKLNIRANIRTIIEGSKAREAFSSGPDVSEDEVGIQELYEFLVVQNIQMKNDEERRKKTLKAENSKALAQDARGFFDTFNDISGLVKDAVKKLNGLKKTAEGAATLVQAGFHMTETIKRVDLLNACENVFDMTFEKFLDTYGMTGLKPIFVYAYQVQGYGTLSRIPAYYGMIWVTPATMLEKIKRQFVEPEPGSEEAKRGTVNIVKGGWLSLWENVVDHGKLSENILFHASVTSIDREC